MKLAELALELTRAQLQRQSRHGKVPLIMSVNFVPLDDAGKIFSCRATFSFGPDFTSEIALDAPADMSGDWQERLDAALFDHHDCRWQQ